MIPLNYCLLLILTATGSTELFSMDGGGNPADATDRNAAASHTRSPKMGTKTKPEQASMATYTKPSSLVSKEQHQARFARQIVPLLSDHSLTIDVAKDFLDETDDAANQGLSDTHKDEIVAYAESVKAAVLAKKVNYCDMEHACSSLYLLIRCISEEEEREKALNLGRDILFWNKDVIDVIDAGIKSPEWQWSNRASRAIDLLEIFVHRDPNHSFILEKRCLLAGSAQPANTKSPKNQRKGGLKSKTRLNNSRNARSKNWLSGLLSNVLSKKSLLIVGGLAAIAGAAVYWQKNTTGTAQPKK